MDKPEEGFADASREADGTAVGLCEDEIKTLEATWEEDSQRKRLMLLFSGSAEMRFTN